ncbi:hypothetical protein ACVWW2_008304 [Bradyrhizobium sp. LM4.3]
MGVPMTIAPAASTSRMSVSERCSDPFNGAANVAGDDNVVA